MKNLSRYILLFMIIIFLKSTANPIVILYISEIVPDSTSFTMEILTSDIDSLEGWYITSLTDTSFLNDGLSTDDKYLVITQDSLKSPFSIDPKNDEITLYSPSGQMDRLVYGDKEHGSVSSPIPGQSICLNVYFDLFQNYYYYLDNSPTLGFDNDTSGALGWMEGFVVDSLKNPVPGIELIYGYKEVSHDFTIYYTVVSDSDGYFLFEDISRVISLYMKSESGFGEYILSKQIYPGDTVSVQITFSVTDMDLPNNKPGLTGITLEQNFPNPFNNRTTFYYILERNEYIEISVYDLSGRLVDKLYSGYQRSGKHKMVWDAGIISSGIYIINLRSLNLSITNKCVHLK